MKPFRLKGSHVYRGMDWGRANCAPGSESAPCPGVLRLIETLRALCTLYGVARTAPPPSVIRVARPMRPGPSAHGPGRPLTGGPVRPIQEFPAHPGKQKLSAGPGRANPAGPIFVPGPRRAGRKIEGPGRAARRR